MIKFIPDGNAYEIAKRSGRAAQGNRLPITANYEASRRVVYSWFNSSLWEENYSFEYKRRFLYAMVCCSTAKLMSVPSEIKTLL